MEFRQAILDDICPLCGGNLAPVARNEDGILYVDCLECGFVCLIGTVENIKRKEILYWMNRELDNIRSLEFI